MGPTNQKNGIHEIAHKNKNAAPKHSHNDFVTERGPESMQASASRINNQRKALFKATGHFWWLGAFSYKLKIGLNALTHTRAAIVPRVEMYTLQIKHLQEVGNDAFRFIGIALSSRGAYSFRDFDQLFHEKHKPYHATVLPNT